MDIEAQNDIKATQMIIYILQDSYLSSDPN